MIDTGELLVRIIEGQEQPFRAVAGRPVEPVEVAILVDKDIAPVAKRVDMAGEASRRDPGTLEEKPL